MKQEEINEPGPNKYWKKLCTPEQNQRQIGALIVLATGLTILLLTFLLGN